MPSALPRALLDIEYEEAAQEYLRSLPLEHFVEATAQATQRKITLESFDLVHAVRPEVQVFNELLVQYELRGKARQSRKKGQIVPDNMVVICDQPIKASSSFNLPLQPVGPFWVFEYVSKSNKRKDYVKSFAIYEKALKVPFHLIYYPDNEELSLYRHNGKRYVSVHPDDQERFAVPDMEIELGLVDGWVRFWFRGKLLPLPAEMQRELEEAKRETGEARKVAEAAQKEAEEAKREAKRSAELLAEERAARSASERELEQLRAQLKARNGKKGQS